MEVQVTFDKTFNFNTTLQFKCNAGFILPDMYEGYRQCKENETWSGLEPTCSGNYLGHQREMGLCGVCCQIQTSTNRTNVRKALRLALSSPSEVIAMLKELSQCIKAKKNKSRSIFQTRRGRGIENKNKRKSNRRTKSTNISFLFPKRGNRNAKRIKKYKNKITKGKL